MKLLTVKDILEFALEIEDNGYEFYNYLENKEDDEELKKLFGFLKNEENNHKVIFTKMLEDFSTNVEFESFNDDYQDYLDELTKNLIFSGELKDKILEQIKSAYDAVTFALEREKDTIIFFNEHRQYIDEGSYEIIDKIIDEEKNHYKLLSSMKRDILSRS